MKIKTVSWVLGGAYILCGLILFAVMSRCQVAFSERGIALPAPTRAAFAISPLGWLLLTVTIGSIVVLKDLAFPWRVLNYAFFIVLIDAILFLAFAMVVPTIPA